METPRGMESVRIVERGTVDPQAERDALVAGLRATPATISPKYFYDARGSPLFEEITRLPEYYPTRTERAIMRHHGAEIARRVGPGRTVIELGAGNCEKARELCEAIAAARFVAVDISEEFLQHSVARRRPRCRPCR